VLSAIGLSLRGERQCREKLSKARGLQRGWWTGGIRTISFDVFEPHFPRIAGVADKQVVASPPLAPRSPLPAFLIRCVPSPALLSLSFSAVSHVVLASFLPLSPLPVCLRSHPLPFRIDAPPLRLLSRHVFHSRGFQRSISIKLS
jgi:hypothetical protein